MKMALAALICLHGLIHLFGFLKAYGLGEFPMLTENYSRIHGLIWLLASVLFLLALFFLFMNPGVWPWLGLLAVILSQILIALSWSDAKHGSWINLLLFMVVISHIAENRFNARVENEVRQLFAEQEESLKLPDYSTGMRYLPPAVENWIQRSGFTGDHEIRKVHLKQSGKMRTSPGGRWMQFTAEQWFSLKEPGFVWKTRVKMIGPIFLSGRDRLISGNGSMDILLASVIPVVREKDDPKIDQGTKIRFMAEICWFPPAAREPYLHWEPLENNSARASFSEDRSISGVFQFNSSGEMISFQAERYMGSGENARKQTWKVNNSSYAEFGKVRIPDKSEVFWVLEEGEFHWLSLEITEISYE
jgi:hypothetical protein